ncbi:MAG: M23 family metallopeptidase [Candidatus Marinimicrobia bacterium]|nr:M23 family metallopeptidase [Candidatus Neomarinimicrobiota bacterium]
MRLLTALTLILSFIRTQDYTWPTDVGKHLSSNFGEFRATGYHLGLDMKTKGTAGHPVYAVSDGYVSRIVTNYSGFGRALYLTLDDDQTAVYAHLSKFIPRLEDRLKQEQELGQSYMTNIFLSPEEFQFEKGDVIAYSGNTGFSFGPHLHLEIRNKHGQTLNPLNSGLNQADRLAPIVEDISLIPLNSESWVNGNQLPQNFPLFRDKKGEYHFPDTINISGSLGLSIKTFDKRQGANNIYQPHRIEIYIDEKLHHSLQFDRLDYNWLPTANYIRDYRNARLNLGDFIKLYRNEADPRVPIHADSTNGILDLTPGYHSVKILVMDVLKNTRAVHGTVFKMAPFKVVLEKLGETDDIVSFLIQPKSITIPIQSIIAYSFTTYGFAEEEIDIQSSEPIESGRIITVPKKQTERKALQFIARNKLGTRSLPVHWVNPKYSADHLSVNVDLDISHTDAGVYIQIQPEQIVDAELSLRLKGKYQYETIPLNQIQPSVYLTAPIPAVQFENVDQIEAILKGSIERQVRFDFPYTVAMPGTTITTVSKDSFCSIRTKKSSVSEPTLMWIEAVHKHATIKNGNLLSRVYQLQPFERPLLKPVNIGVRYSSKLKDKKNIHLYYFDQKEGWSFIATENNKERQVLTGEVKHLDAIAIIEDVIPPIIKSMHPGNHGNYPSLELNQFKIKIDDALSGFEPVEDSFDFELDHKPLIFAYQPKVKIITYELERPLPIGTHTIQFKARDRAGNETRKNIEFKVY